MIFLLELSNKLIGEVNYLGATGGYYRRPDLRHFGPLLVTLLNDNCDMNKLSQSFVGNIDFKI